jgi:hypothetical protein
VSSTSGHQAAITTAGKTKLEKELRLLYDAGVIYLVLLMSCVKSAI